MATGTIEIIHPSTSTDLPPSDPAEEAPRSLPEGGPWSPPYRRTTIGLLLSITCSAFEALAVATIMPATVDDLGGLRYYGWAFTAFLLTNMIGLVVGGSEADRTGPGAPFAAGVLLFTSGLFLGGFAPSMPVLIVGRAVQGFGGGLISAVVYVVVSRAFPDSSRPRMLALTSTAWVVPGLIGPAIASLIATHIGWRWVFLGLAPMPLLALFLTAPALRGVPGGDAVSRNWARIRSALRLALGVALFLAGLDQSHLWLAVPLTIAGIAISARALPRLLPAGTLRAARGLPASIATMGLLTLAFFGVDAFVPLALTDVRDRSTTFAGLALTAGTITWTTGAWIQAHYARSISPRSIIRIGLCFVALGILGIIGVIATEVSAWFGPVAWSVSGFGIGLAYSSLTLAVMESAEPGHEGTATSAMQLTTQVGAGLSTGTGGALIALLATGETASALGVSLHFALMIGATILAIFAAGGIAVRPGRAG